MSTTRVTQALIVAGPSCAGKTAFLQALAAGQVPHALMAELPQGAERWPVVCAGKPDQWSVFDQRGGSGGGLDGVTIHYDVTTAWNWHSRNFKQDPFWRLLGDCPVVTWVEIRPSKHRLIAQWCNVRLGRPSVLGIRLWNLRAAAVTALLAILRRLRRQTGTAADPHWRYPRALRFLKRVDLRLRGISSIPTSMLEFYRQSGNVEHMLDRWDEAVGEIIGPRLAKRITLAPDQDSLVGRRVSWRIIDAAAYAPPAKATAIRTN